MHATAKAQRGQDSRYFSLLYKACCAPNSGVPRIWKSSMGGVGILARVDHPKRAKSVLDLFVIDNGDTGLVCDRLQ